mgnify:CR=1 FL=1
MKLAPWSASERAASWNDGAALMSPSDICVEAAAADSHRRAARQTFGLGAARAAADASTTSEGLRQAALASVPSVDASASRTRLSLSDDFSRSAGPTCRRWCGRGCRRGTDAGSAAGATRGATASAAGADAAAGPGASRPSFIMPSRRIAGASQRLYQRAETGDGTWHGRAHLPRVARKVTT